MHFLVNNTDIIIFIMEIIGTVAFASSGALIAFQKKMDIFGVNVLAIITAVGGGCIRDIIIGRTPPVMFTKPVYALVAMITCNLLFLLLFLGVITGVGGGVLRDILATQKP